MNRLCLLVVGLLLAPVVAAQQREGAAAETQPATKPADPGLYPRVKLETSLGDIVLELNAEKAPITVHNFVRYVEDGFYDGTIFHRVIPTFMIQGGGYTSDFEQKREGLRPPIRNEWENGLKNQRGTIAMARLAEPDSAVSQFYINVVDNDMLDKPRGGAAYCVFGRVVEGMDVVDKIKDVPTRVDPREQRRYERALEQGRFVPEPEKSQPLEPPVIKSAKLIGPYARDKVAAMVEEKERAAREAAATIRAAKEKQVQEYVQKVEQETGKKVEKTASGLMYVILKEGDGPAPAPDDMAQVLYTGRFLDGTEFDSNQNREHPFTFSLRRGVIKGWLEGVALMKVGENRRLIIPPELAYGERGSPPRIPPNEWLVFDIELLGVQPRSTQPAEAPPQP